MTQVVLNILNCLAENRRQHGKNRGLYVYRGIPVDWEENTQYLNNRQFIIDGHRGMANDMSLSATTTSYYHIANNDEISLYSL